MHIVAFGCCNIQLVNSSFFGLSFHVQCSIIQYIFFNCLYLALITSDTLFVQQALTRALSAEKEAKRKVVSVNVTVQTFSHIVCCVAQTRHYEL